MLRLGHEMNWVKGLTRQRFNELMVWIRPAYLQVLHGRAIAGEERDQLRANMLRPHLLRVKLESGFNDRPLSDGALGEEDSEGDTSR